MDLLKNPFQILGATTRDDRRRIVALAEERGLSLDPDCCAKARSELMNPRSRLAAEVAWLPGVSPSRTAELIRSTEEKPLGSRSQPNIPHLAKANLMAFGLQKYNRAWTAQTLAHWICEIGQIYEEVDVEGLAKLIDEDRLVAGFPEISDISTVEEELKHRRRHYLAVIKDTLNKLRPAMLIATMTCAVREAPINDEGHAPILVDDLADSFEVETLGFLEKEERNIEKLIGVIHKGADNGRGKEVIGLLFNRLEEVLGNWHRVARPIQWSKKRRGLGHEMSRRNAAKIRDLAVHLVNEHNLITDSQRITALLQKIFEEVPDVATKLKEDSETIDEIVKNREKELAEDKKQIQEWANEISFAADLGRIFEAKLRISTEGVQWKDRLFPLDSINRVRWGGIRQIVNGIPSGTTYTIYFGNSEELAKVETTKENIYSEFTQKLWRAVCARILTEMLQKMAQGQKYVFGDAVVDDHGVEIIKRKLIGDDKRFYGKWSELGIADGPGYFQISSLNDEKVYACLSYLEVDNVHILETAIRVFWKKGGERLSSFLHG